MPDRAAKAMAIQNGPDFKGREAMNRKFSFHLGFRQSPLVKPDLSTVSMVPVVVLVPPMQFPTFPTNMSSVVKWGRYE